MATPSGSPAPSGPLRPLRRELGNILALLLPSEPETDLLRACLLSGEAGRLAWRRFRHQVTDPAGFFRRDGYGIRRLAPLLLRNLDGFRDEVEPALLTTLRTARLHEDLRTAEYLRICNAAWETLDRASIRFLLLKGAALGIGVYGDPALRHAHDIDILIREPDRAGCLGALTAAGWSESDQPIGLTHPSGLPILLHHSLFPGGPSLHPDPGNRLWERAETIGGDGSVSVLSPAHALLHALGHGAMSSRRRSLAWVPDSCFLIARRLDLDWHEFLRAAAGGRLALPIFVMLRYLAESFSAPIPIEVLARIEAAAREASSLERDLALYHAREGRALRATFLALRSRGWRTRLYWLRTLLLPSPAYVRWSAGGAHSALLPVHYFRRPASYLWQAAARRFQRAPALDPSQAR